MALIHLDNLKGASITHDFKKDGTYEDSLKKACDAFKISNELREYYDFQKVTGVFFNASKNICTKF
jgi:hypothetical protein